MSDECMTSLVVGDQPSLLLIHHPRLALRAGHDAIDGFLDLLHLDRTLVATRGEQRCLVDDVREVGPGEPRRAPCEQIQLHRGVERLAASVNTEDRLAPFDVGPIEHYLPVEPSGSQQRRVEDVGPVGRRHQDHGRALVESVHLDEQLIQRLLALVVAAPEAGTSVSADGVGLVDEHDRRRRGLRLLEEIAHSRSADADEHLNEVRTADREERHACLARHGAREQRLPRARWPEQEHAARDLRPHRLELRRRLEVVLDLLELLDRLIDAGHVGERRLRHVLGNGFVAAAPELHDPSAATL